SVVGFLLTASSVGTRRARGGRRHDVLGKRTLLHMDKRNGYWGSTGASLLGGGHWLSCRVPLRVTARAGGDAAGVTHRGVLVQPPAELHRRAGVGQRVQR